MDHSINKKSNWGKGLTLAIIIFILSMLGMVYISFQQTNEMVEENYYERELEYQKIIDAKDELGNYKSHEYLKIQNGEVHFSLPTALTNDFNVGSLEFLKLDNQKLDKKIELSSTNLNDIILPVSEFQGEYLVKIRWKNGKKDYFYEKEHLIK